LPVDEKGEDGSEVRVRVGPRLSGNNRYNVTLTLKPKDFAKITVTLKHVTVKK
jgi:hypothetical protein